MWLSDRFTPFCGGEGRDEGLNYISTSFKKGRNVSIGVFICWEKQREGSLNFWCEYVAHCIGCELLYYFQTKMCDFHHSITDLPPTLLPSPTYVTKKDILISKKMFVPIISDENFRTKKNNNLTISRHISDVYS